MIDKLAQRYGKHNVWNDFIYFSAAAMSQPMNYKQNREDEYLRKINSYDKESQDMFAAMFAELTLAFEEESFGDILGDIYSSMNMTNAGNGQFFTPYPVCQFMSAINAGDDLIDEIEKKGYISVSDPCCGAGAMLVAFAEQCVKQDINYQNSVLFAAQDIDPAAALMCYVQMSLLGMPGYVIIGNSLSNEIPDESSIWYTPLYFLSGFQYRTQKKTITSAKTASNLVDDIIEQPETQKTETIIPATEIDIVLREAENGQFTFGFDDAAS